MPMSSPVADSSGRNRASSGCQVLVGREPVVRHETQAAPLVGCREGFLPPGERAGLTEQLVRGLLGAGDCHDLHEVGVVHEVDHSDPEAEPLDDSVSDRLKRGRQVRAAVDPQDQPLQIAQREQAEVTHVVIDLRSVPAKVLGTVLVGLAES